MNQTSDIDTTSIARIETDLQIAEDAGLKFEGHLLYPPGTKLFESGVETARRSREEFENRPLFEDVADRARAAYKLQRRKDFEVDVTELRMDPETGKVGRGGAKVDVTQTALGQIMGRFGAEGGHSGYLMGCSPRLRAYNFNDWAGTATLAEKRAQAESKKYRPPTAKLRTMFYGEEPTAYACLAPTYNVRDLPDVLSVFEDKLDRLGASGARGDFRMDGPRWQIRATFHSAIRAEDLRVGDVFRGAIWTSGMDDGTGSVRIGVGVERARCKNLTTIWAKDVQGLRHNSRNFDQRLGEIMEQAVKAISGFAGKWAEASKQSIIEQVHEGLEPQKVFVLLVKKGLVKLPGVSQEEMVERLVRAWSAEPGYQRADIVNAVTRCAHTETWKSPWHQEELEAQGGQLLYNHVVISQREYDLA